MINLIFTLVVLSAIIIALMVIGSLIVWFRGVDVVALPGLGIIVTTPFVTILLTVLQFVLIIAAIFVFRHRPGVDTFTMT